jgi:tRNA wybutosine-synthesizing protein 3
LSQFQETISFLFPPLFFFLIMDAFDTAKKDVVDVLGTPDKSRQGHVDEAAWPFIKVVNALPDYYTTSSCAGRINVFREPASGKKYEAEWLFVTHDLAQTKDVVAALQDLPPETIWLRMESPIFHIACRHQEAADVLLKICQAAGWKRSGIISTGGRTPRQQRVMLEIVGNERIDTPIAVDGKLLFEEKFIKFLVEKANEKLLLTRRKLDDLRKLVKTLE